MAKNKFKGVVVLSRDKYNNLETKEEGTLYVKNQFVDTPEKVSELENDSKFLNQEDLENISLDLKNTPKVNGKDIALKEDIPTLVNNLESDSTAKPLAAAQGKVLNEKISNVMATMHGKNNAFTIKSLTDLATLFGIEIINIEDSYTVATNVITYNETQYTLKNGDVFYVVDTNVPDYWFSKDDYKLYKMETTKVDLSQYALITKVDEKNAEQDEIISKKPGLKVSDGEIFNNYENNVATGGFSHAEGNKNTASGLASHAEGSENFSSGDISHAEGINNKAIGDYTHVEGQGNEAEGIGSHAEGVLTKAKGNVSHTEGGYTEATGVGSHAGGYFTKADQNFQMAIGVANEENKTGALFSVGGGTVDDEMNVTERKTVFEVFQDGRVEKNGVEVATVNDVPEANNGTLTIQKNGVTLGTFSANQSSDSTINITTAEEGGGSFAVEDKLSQVDLNTIANAGNYGIASDCINIPSNKPGTLFVGNYENGQYAQQLFIDGENNMWVRTSTTVNNSMWTSWERVAKLNLEQENMLINATSKTHNLWDGEYHKDKMLTSEYGVLQGATGYISGKNGINFFNGDIVYFTKGITLWVYGPDGKSIKATSGTSYNDYCNYYTISYDTSVYDYAIASFYVQATTVQYKVYISKTPVLKYYPINNDIATLGDCMSIIDPVASGTLSLNRSVNSNIGKYSVSLGGWNYATADYSNAQGYYTQARGKYSMATNYHTDAFGNYSHAEGYYSIAAGKYSHAEGGGYESSGPFVWVEVLNENTVKLSSTSSSQLDNFEKCKIGEIVALEINGETKYFKITGKNSNNYSISLDTESSFTQESLTSSFMDIMSPYSIAFGEYSHAEGQGTSALGNVSHAEGYYTYAQGDYSHAEGKETFATHAAQHVIGAYNALDESTNTSNERGTYVEIVGNGETDNSRSNARTLDWDGNEVLSGSVTATGFKIPDGTSSQVLTADGGIKDDLVPKSYVDEKIDSMQIVKSVNGQTGDITGLATEQYVQENGGKIDSFLVNGIEQPITNKNVNIKIPTFTLDGTTLIITDE